MFCDSVGLKSPTKLKKLKLCVVYFMVALHSNGHGVIILLNLPQMWAALEVNRPMSHCKKGTLKRRVEDGSRSPRWADPVPRWSGLAKYFAGRLERSWDLLDLPQAGRGPMPTPSQPPDMPLHARGLSHPAGMASLCAQRPWRWRGDRSSPAGTFAEGKPSGGGKLRDLWIFLVFFLMLLICSLSNSFTQWI